MPRIFSAVLCTALLAGCASTNARPQRAAAIPAPTPRPAWVDGADAGYPRGRFLTGVSSADDLNAAKDRARGEISKVFSAQVTVNSAVAAAEYTSQTQGKTLTSSSQNASQNVRAVSQKNLEGVEIAATWRDPANGQYFALAVLERSKALASLEEKVRETDAQTRDLTAQLAAAPEKLQKAKYALKLLGLLKAREGLAADMRVLDPAGASAPGPDQNAARRAAAKALAGVDVVLVMTADSSAPVTAAVVKALNGIGIEARVAGSAGGADIAAECAAQLSAVADADPQSRWHWHRGTASVALKDVKTDRIFLNFDAAAKEASASAGEARLKTETALGKKLAAEILRGISAYLENQ